MLHFHEKTHYMPVTVCTSVRPGSERTQRNATLNTCLTSRWANTVCRQNFYTFINGYVSACFSADKKKRDISVRIKWLRKGWLVQTSTQKMPLQAEAVLYMLTRFCECVRMLGGVMCAWMSNPICTRQKAFRLSWPFCSCSLTTAATCAKLAPPYETSS